MCILIPDETRKDDWSTVANLEPLKDKVVSIGIAAGKHAFIEPPEGLWRHDVSNTDLVEGLYILRHWVCYPKHVIEAIYRY